jgi:hypothetical protein
MSQDFETDPEVIADLALRRASERDPTRTRGEGIYDWKPSIAVGVWACRNPRCSGLASVFQENVDAVAVFNAHLAQLGELPLDETKILWCESCLAEYKRTAPDRRRGQVDRMAVAIRALKESDDAERERDLIANLDAWGHPDVLGLVSSIRERRAAESGRGRKRAL